MAFRESELETWAAPGSQVGSATTYKSVQEALDGLSPTYDRKDIEIYLQGSYGNSTNIRVESDVDIVVCFLGTTLHNFEHVTQSDRLAFFPSVPSVDTARYTLFKSQVQRKLADKFGASSVIAGSKCFKVTGSGARRNADVLCCHQYEEHVSRGNGLPPQTFHGICFLLPVGTSPIVNFPKIHRDNCISKNQRAMEQFKRVVRVVKNIRRVLENKGDIARGLAPSYFLECLLYNVPDHLYLPRLEATLPGVLNWLSTANVSIFWCANKRRLLFGNAPTQWRIEQYQIFLRKVIAIWNAGK